MKRKRPAEAGLIKFFEINADYHTVIINGEIKMAKAMSVDWTVRFPLNIYSQVSEKILNQCLTGTVNPPLVGHRFEDVSFVVTDGCDKQVTLEALIKALNAIADKFSLEVRHQRPRHISAFEVDYHGNGKKEINFV